MKQKLIISASENQFKEDIDDMINQGFKHITGSTFIKALPSTVDIENGECLNDIDHVFTIVLKGEKDRVIVSRNPKAFTMSVNEVLGIQNMSIVVGSMTIDPILLDGFQEAVLRMYETYYCCGFYKE